MTFKIERWDAKIKADWFSFDIAPMKVQKRHECILEALRKKKKISVDELSEEFQVSHETMRRDLSLLANEGKLQKVHGGAILPKTLEEGSFLHKMSKNEEAKIKIAECAVELFSQNETLFIATGSTTIFFAEKILDSAIHIKVVTNSVEIAQTVAKKPENQVFLLGGHYMHDTRQTVSAMVLNQIKDFRAHHAVLTIAALGAEFGAMDLNLEDAQIAQTFIKESASVTVLVDSSKFESLATFQVCPLSDIDRVVCDIEPPQQLREALIEAGVELFVVDSGDLTQKA